LIFSTTSNGRYDLTIKPPRSFGWISKYVPLGEFPLPPINLGSIPLPPPLPPIPLIIFPKVEVGVDFAGSINASLELGASQEVTFTEGVKYNNGQWSPITNWQHYFQINPPVFTPSSFGFRVSGGPTVKFPLYGVAGPKLKVLGGLEAEVYPEKWAVYGRFDGTIGVEMKVFKHVFANFNAPLFGFKKLLLEGGVSPDQGSITFSAAKRRDGNTFFHISSINSDGTNEKDLSSVSTSSPIRHITPSWDSNKSKIIFSKDFDIYSMNPDGTNLQEILDGNSSEVRYYYPVFSQDGTKIAYVHQNTSSIYDQIYIIDADGTNPKNLTNSPSYQHDHPSWCLNDKIIFYSLRDDRYKIYSIKSDGTALTDLSSITTATKNDFEPSCSPDGNKIAFKSDRSGNNDIWVMNLNGSNPVNITDTPTFSEGHPSWSPDGSKILYLSSDGMWTINANGTGKTKIRDVGDVYDPKWSR